MSISWISFQSETSMFWIDLVLCVSMILELIVAGPLILIDMIVTPEG